MALKSAKQLLRKELKRRIANLSSEEKERQSLIVTQKLLQTVQYQSSKRISVFLSMKDEIQTESIVKHILESQRECFIPRYIGPRMDMVKLYSMEDYHNLPETSWHIKQPRDDDVREDALEKGGLDLILIPGLGFSRDGARLGRGKGYYDSYLTKVALTLGRMPDTIALSFYEQLCDSIPMSDHDRMIDLVLYEDKEEKEAEM